MILEQDPVLPVIRTLDRLRAGGRGRARAHEAAAIAEQLGIDLGREAATASGGERRRAAIVRALAQSPTCCSSTNRPTTSTWPRSNGSKLAGALHGAFVAISHDRTFLTRLTKSCLWLDRGTIRRNEIGFGGFEAWTEQVYAEEARAADKLDAKLKLELHWLQRGVTARRKRNQGRLAKLRKCAPTARR